MARPGGRGEARHNDSTTTIFFALGANTVIVMTPLAAL